jgi:hypothetical protein
MFFYLIDVIGRSGSSSSGRNSLGDRLVIGQLQRFPPYVGVKDKMSPVATVAKLRELWVRGRDLSIRPLYVSLICCVCAVQERPMAAHAVKVNKQPNPLRHPVSVQIYPSTTPLLFARWTFMLERSAGHDECLTKSRPTLPTGCHPQPARSAHGGAESSCATVDAGDGSGRRGGGCAVRAAKPRSCAEGRGLGTRTPP